jgi:hypothetical protein
MCKAAQTVTAHGVTLRFGTSGDFFMNTARAFLVAVVLVLTPQIVSAQALTGYRAYVLESSLESVLALSGARATDTRTLHDRPSKIQELEWRAPYTRAVTGTELADPVKGLMFSFCDDALYQVVVTYDPDRTDGLTNADIVNSLTTVYGTPLLASSRNRPLAATPDTVVLAQWDSATSSLTLLRNVYSPEYQLILTSKALSTRARGAIREAARLDTADAPRKELEQRKKAEADAIAARDKMRANNRAAFRP